MASAQFLGAFMSGDDRRRSGGCLPLEQITRERTRWASADRSKISWQSIDRGYPIYSVLESAHQGSCCSSRALRADQSEAVYRVMNQYSQDVEYAENFLHRETLGKLLAVYYDKIDSELRSKNSDIEAVREYQRLDEIYESFYYYDSEENVFVIPVVSPEESKYRKEISDKRNDAYERALREIQKKLESDPAFRDLKSQIEALEKEQKRFAPFVPGIAGENAVRKLEHALSPEDCIMEPTDQDLIKGHIDDLIRFSLEALARIPDGPMGFLIQRVKELCNGQQQIPLSAEIKNAKRFARKVHAEEEFAEKIKSNLTGKEPKPVLLSFCSEVLKTKGRAPVLANKEIEESSRKTALSLRNYNPNSLNCVWHAVVLIGARWKDGQCQYLVRDSASGLEKQQWVPADILIHASSDVITVR
jgi:hypothetical protein